MELLFSILFFIFVFARAVSEAQRKKSRRAGEEVPPRPTAPGWPPVFPGPFGPGRDFPPVNLPPWWEEEPEEALPPATPAPAGPLPGTPGRAAPVPAEGEADQTPLTMEGVGGQEGVDGREGEPAREEGTPGGEGRDTLHPEHEAYLPPPPAAAAAAPLPVLSGRELARAVLLAEVLGPPRARRPHRVKFR